MVQEVRRVGVLIIGHSPRPDLAAPLQKKLSHLELIQVGALDHLTASDLPKSTITRYPLSTRLRDGTVVQVEELFLEPLLQKALDALETQEIVASIVLCAGSFCGLRGQKPLFKPFDIATGTLAALGITRIAVITPFENQKRPTEKRWRAAGFDPTAFTAQLSEIDLIQKRCQGQTGVVLDFVGHSPNHVLRLRRKLTIPVVDLGDLAMSILAQAVDRDSVEISGQARKNSGCG
mgnify:CR=1 FL=1